MNKECI